jgi:outer membrane protein
MSKLVKLSGLCLAVMVIGCESMEPAEFDLRAMQQQERERSREVAPTPKRPLPTTLESPFLAPAGTPAERTAPPTTGRALESEVNVRLPLQEIIHRAVANNLDIKVSGYQPAIDETRVIEAQARFDPTFFDNLQYQRQDTQSGFGFSSSNGRIIQSQTGVRQNMESGGQAELRYETSWTEPFRPNFGAPRQFWNNQLVMEVTQPLLQNFGNEINRARIVINRYNQRISLLEFRKQVETSLSEVERTYWQLVDAEQSVKVDENLLQRTIDTAEILQKRMGQDVTRVQLSQANSRIERRRAILIRAKAKVRDLSDHLKRLMNDPGMPVSGALLILPQDAPSILPLDFKQDELIATALENRLELGEQQLRIDSAVVAEAVARNNLLPQLNMVGSMGIQGLQNNVSQAIREQRDWSSLNYTVGFQLQIPIGNREARAIHTRSVRQRQQALVAYQNLIAQIAESVTSAVREVDTTWQEMVATRQARFAAYDALLAIEQREAGGEALTPNFVDLKLNTQEQVAEAELAMVTATSNYNIAISQLELAKGTLLRYNNVVMEEQNLPSGTQSR